MKIIQLIFFCTLLFSCTNNKNNFDNSLEKANDKIEFETLEDFNLNRNKFTKDTLEIERLSSEGGEVIVYHSSEKDYIVLDINLFGEMGKINNVYFSDKKMNLIFAEIKKFNYDKPIYESDFKTDSTVYYLNYIPEFKAYNSKKIILSDKMEIENLKKSAEEIYKETLKKVQIRK